MAEHPFVHWLGLEKAVLDSAENERNRENRRRPISSPSLLRHGEEETVAARTLRRRPPRTGPVSWNLTRTTPAFMGCGPECSCIGKPIRGPPTRSAEIRDQTRLAASPGSTTACRSTDEAHSAGEAFRREIGDRKTREAVPTAARPRYGSPDERSGSRWKKTWEQLR